MVYNWAKIGEKYQFNITNPNKPISDENLYMVVRDVNEPNIISGTQLEINRCLEDSENDMHIFLLNLINRQFIYGRANYDGLSKRDITDIDTLKTGIKQLLKENGIEPDIRKYITNSDLPAAHRNAIDEFFK